MQCKIKVIPNIARGELKTLKPIDGIILVITSDMRSKFLILDGEPISLGAVSSNIKVIARRKIVDFNLYMGNAIDYKNIEEDVHNLVKKQLCRRKNGKKLYDEIGKNIVLCLTKYRSEKLRAISQHMYYSIALSAVLSIPAVILSLVNYPVFLLLKQPARIAIKVQHYFYVLAPYFPSVLFYSSLQQILLGLKKPWSVTILVSATSIFTSVFGYILIWLFTNLSGLFSSSKMINVLDINLNHPNENKLHYEISRDF